MAGNCGLVGSGLSNTGASRLANAAADLVQQRYGYGYTKANEAYETAKAVLSTLTALTDLEIIDVSLSPIEEPNLNVLDMVLDKPTKPVFDDLPELALFQFAEDLYVSDLLEKLKDVLYIDLRDGGTGLSAETEDAIFQRETERDAQANADAKDQIAADWAELGDDLPDGVFFANLAKVEQDYQNARLDKSRKIAERSEEIAIENTRFAKTTSVNLENVLMGNHNNIQNRKLEAAKAALTAGGLSLDAVVKKIQAQATIYESEAGVYEATAEGLAAIAGVHVDAYKAKTTYLVSTAELQLKQLELQIKQVETQAELEVEVAKTSGHIAAAIASGALSGVSASAHLSGSGSASESASTSVSTSNSNSAGCNTTYYYDKTEA